MALVSKMVSDISGEEASEEDFVNLVIREHPSIDEPRALDVLPTEVERFKGADNLVVLEVRSNGESRQLVLSLTEFRKIVKDEIVASARKTRGRRPGSQVKKTA